MRRRMQRTPEAGSEVGSEEASQWEKSPSPDFEGVFRFMRSEVGTAKPPIYTEEAC